MAANLVRRYSPEQARHLLNLSFAQYRADRDVVRLETQLERTAQHLEEARHDAECELGDVEEYRALVRAAEEGRGGSSTGSGRTCARAWSTPSSGSSRATCWCCPAGSRRDGWPCCPPPAAGARRCGWGPSPSTAGT